MVCLAIAAPAALVSWFLLANLRATERTAQAWLLASIGVAGAGVLVILVHVFAQKSAVGLAEPGRRAAPPSAIPPPQISEPAGGSCSRESILYCGRG